jgi:hypothetical protein
MNNVLSKIVLAVVAAGSCAAAGAQMSDSADQERRARNREEAIANHERMQQRADMSRSDMRRDRTSDASPTVGQRIDSGAQSTKELYAPHAGQDARFRRETEPQASGARPGHTGAGQGTARDRQVSRSTPRRRGIETMVCLMPRRGAA